MANESAMIGGGGASTFNNLLLLAQEFGRTGDPVARQRLIECYVREKTLNLLADRIMGAIRRRERPPVDPSILKLSIALNKAVTGDVAVELAGAAALQTDDEIGRWVSSELLSRYGISIGGGTNEVQRNNLAERALGLPKEPTVSRDTPWAQLLRSCTPSGASRRDTRSGKESASLARSQAPTASWASFAAGKSKLTKPWGWPA